MVSGAVMKLVVPTVGALACLQQFAVAVLVSCGHRVGAATKCKSAAGESTSGPTLDFDLSKIEARLLSVMKLQIVY